MKMRWFGESWRAPINELEHVPAPVGERCLFCDDQIVEGDCGLLLATVVRDSLKGQEVSPEPVHLECFLAHTLGRHTARVLDEMGLPWAR